MWPVKDESLLGEKVWGEVGGGGEKNAVSEKLIFLLHCPCPNFLHIQLQLFGWRRKAEEFPLHTCFKSIKEFWPAKKKRFEAKLNFAGPSD